MALEKTQEQQSDKDSEGAPNMEMKFCGSNLVAEYLEQRRQALQDAKKAAQEARSGQSGDRYSSTSGSSTIVDDQAFGAAAATTSMVKEGGALADSSTATAAKTEEELRTNLATKQLREVESESEQTELTDSESAPVQRTEIQHVTDEKIPKATSCTEQEKLEGSKQAVLAEKSAASVELGEDLENDPTERLTREISGEPEEPMTPANKIRENGDQKYDSESLVRQRSRSVNRSSSEQSLGPDEQHSESESPEEAEDSEQVDYSRRAAEQPKKHEEHAEEIEGEYSQGEEVADHMPAQSWESSRTLDSETNHKQALDDSIEHEKADAAAAEEKPQKKRRWGSTTVGKRATVSISSDSLKDIVGHVKTTDAILTSTMEEQIQLDYDEEPLPKRIVISRDDAEEEDPVETTTKEEAVPKKEEKKPRFPSLADPLYDEGFVRERPPSPARRPVSNIIHIRCLTRPFTVKLLLEFLSKSGKLVKEDFWIDNIKSHCFVTYERQEDAINAREKMDNIRWPMSNPNVLHAEFATESDLERYRQKTAKENEKPMSRTVDTDQRNSDSSKPKERIVREIVTNEAQEKSRGDRSPKRDGKADVDLWPKRREWDKGKEDWRNGRSSSPVVSSDKYGRKRLPSPSSRRPDRKEDVAPVKLLEDLFRKTKTAPCLYWLPLSQEQINEKQKQKKKRELERAEKLRKLEEDERDMWRRKESARELYCDSSRPDRNKRR